MTTVEPGRSMIALRGITKSYGTREVLRCIDLDVAAGEVVAVLGPSGSGKSTLLRIINHLERADRGHVEIDGRLMGYRAEGEVMRELPERAVLRQRTDIGFVFQSFNLFANLSVLENLVEAPVHAQGVPVRVARERARDLLSLVGLAGREDDMPSRLSGGQQQRVAIARAMCLEPKVLLLDEPTSALDPELVGEVLDVITRLARAGTTMVIVTHELGFAREVADRVVFMDHGVVVEDGPPDQVINAPREARTRSFMSSIT